MKLVCIMCPLGCNIDVEKSTKEGEYNVVGNSCMRGKDYAINEIKQPKRIVTALVHTKIGVLPVKTTGLVPKDKISNILNALSKILLDKGKIGDVVIKNVLNLNVDVVITGNYIN